MVLGSVPIVVFEVLPIVVATWFLEVRFACLDLGSIPTVVVIFWKFTYRRLGSLPTIVLEVYLPSGLPGSWKCK